MQRVDARLILLSGLIAAVVLGGGCSDEFSDGEYGVLDLASVYDGGSRADPTAGVPQQVYPSAGYIEGQPAEYYDFGLVPVIREPTRLHPVAARVQPMYFFFTPDGFPLASRPVREARDGTDWMRGGKGVLDPNPKNFCGTGPEEGACRERNLHERKKTYPQRFRDLLVDPLRLSADYQRPLIDVNPQNRAPNTPQYTGFWEIVEVTVPRGYEPDSIKHVATLREALASGKYVARPTGKVINCPLVDERTQVLRGVTARTIYRPRIELWYRRLLTTCFLANGWETLGNERGELYFSNSDSERLDTFDLARIVVGDGPVRQEILTVPVRRAYAPYLSLVNEDTGAMATTAVDGNLITDSLPRRTKADPPGYSPLRWLHDFEVPTDYKFGGIQRLSDVDVPNARPKALDAVRNVATRGVAIPCSYPRVTGKFGQPCGREVQNPEDPDGPTIVDPRGDAQCTAEGLECNKDTCFCDAPFVGLGQACGPGVGQCSKEKDSLSEVGYQCFPPWGGYCHLRCSRTGSNARASENEGKNPTEFVDTRCKELPGYQCFTGLEVCLKFCDQNVTEGNQCSATTMVDMEPRDINEGMTCQDWGLQICTWPEGYTAN